MFGAHNHAFACLALIVAVAAPWAPVRAQAMLWMVCYLLWSMKSVDGGRWSGVFVRGALIAVPDLTMFALVTALLLVTAMTCCADRRGGHGRSYFLIRSFAVCSSALPSLPLAVTSFTHSSGRFAVAFSQFASSEAGIT